MLNWLVEFRKNRNLSRDQVAEKMDITVQYYGMIENGVRTPSVKLAKDLSSLLGFEWTNFFK